MPPTKKTNAPPRNRRESTPDASATTTPPPPTTDPTVDAQPDGYDYADQEASGPQEGDAVTYAAHDDSDGFGLVVRAQSEERDDKDQVLRESGVYVVPLPEPVFVPTAQLRD